MLCMFMLRQCLVACMNFWHGIQGMERPCNVVATLSYSSATLLIRKLNSSEVNLARRQNHKLAWEDAWNHGRINL